MTATPLPPVLPPPAKRARTTPTTRECTARTHGTPHAANRCGCICDDALETLRLARKRSRTGRALAPMGHFVDATGTRRMLQALLAIGHSITVIAGYLGMSRQGVSGMLTRDRVHYANAARVAALYGPLSVRPPTLDPSLTDAQRGYLRRDIDRARGLGYLPPLAWEDVDINDPNAKPDMTGVLPPGRRSAHNNETAELLELLKHNAGARRISVAWKRASHPTRAAVVAALSAADRPGGPLPAREIADLLPINARTVKRWRAAARNLAPAAADVEPLAAVA